MKLGWLSAFAALVFGSVLVAVSASASTATAADSSVGAGESNPLRPRALVSLDRMDPFAPETEAFVERMLSSTGEFVSFAITHSDDEHAVADDGDGDAGDAIAVKCGEGVGVVTPKNGVSGQGWGATAGAAYLAAFDDCNDKLWAFSKVKCPPCPVPGQCVPFISVLTGYKVTSLTQSTDGTWHAVVTAYGAYIAGCTDCPL